MQDGCVRLSTRFRLSMLIMDVVPLVDRVTIGTYDGLSAGKTQILLRHLADWGDYRSEKLFRIHIAPLEGSMV